MVTIHKYQFTIADDVVIEMPEGARVLSVQVQNGIPTLWAMVETDWKKEKRKFRVYGTGHALNGLDFMRTHIGTIQLNGFVWHIFE
jgi:hypothetical protein